MSSALASLATSICYVRLAVRDLDAGARFASEIFGLQRVAQQDGDIAFRSDSRFRTVSLVSDEADGGSVGVEMWDEAALKSISQQLDEAGFPVRRASRSECERRYVEAASLVRDGSGNSIDLVVRPRQSGRRYFPSRDAGIVQFHGVGLRTIDSARDLVFWKILGARVSDWVGDIAYLQIDEQHHRVALYPAARSGLLYSAFEVEGLDQIMQNSYFMQERQIKILQGPGRESASHQIFLHLQGPDGSIFSYVNGMTVLGEKPRRPRQFPFANESLCNWGSVSADVPELRVADGRA
jgi:2,3-dihydroxy-p-cumate/2,3-dihydroxybenzoate 3,4-dioxygenase